jgi:hypothetical protein
MSTAIITLLHIGEGKAPRADCYNQPVLNRLKEDY